MRTWRYTWNSLITTWYGLGSRSSESFKITIDLADSRHTDLASGPRSWTPLSTMNHMVINQAAAGRPRQECNWFNSQLGLYNRWRVNCSGQIQNKQNPNPRGGGGSWISSIRGGQDPLGATLMGLSKIHGPEDQKAVTQHWDRFWMPTLEHFPVDSCGVWAWDQCHLKGYLLSFPSI